LEVIKSVIEELRSVGWGKGKFVYFHVFNEPTIDPRLYWLIKHVVERLPGILPGLVTNGWYMNEGLAKELFDAGLYQMGISGYGRNEMNRLRGLGEWENVKLYKAFLYGWLINPTEGRKSWRSCYAPLNDLTIRATGNVGLCCLDYAETVAFGNVNDDPLLTILEREWSRMKGLFDELVHCKRNLRVCQLCHRRRKPYRVGKKNAKHT